MVDAFSVSVVPLLWVDDIENSLAFYKRLGFSVSETWKPDGILTWCNIKMEQAELMLQQRTEGTTDLAGNRAHEEIDLYFICNDVDSLYGTLVGNGLKATKPKRAFYPMIQVFLTDPDGRTICFESPVSTEMDEV